ncbi:MAG: GNAT family N-acetyltransferase [Pseudomonadota bacterium]
MSSSRQPAVILPQLHGYMPQLSDVEYYQQMFSDHDFIACYGVAMPDTRIKEVLITAIDHWKQYHFGPYVWFDKTTGQFVGEGGLQYTQATGRKEVELTYSLSTSCWGKGLATEIGRFALHQGFKTHHLDTIVCFTRVGNTRSLRVIEKLGFHYERDFIYVELSHKLYRLTMSEFALF